jgi:hypothetical protein
MMSFEEFCRSSMDCKEKFFNSVVDDVAKQKDPDEILHSVTISVVSFFRAMDYVDERIKAYHAWLMEYLSQQNGNG